MMLIKCDICKKEVDHNGIDLIIRTHDYVNADLCLACGKPLVEFANKYSLPTVFDKKHKTKTRKK
jgi:hypothetical protein